MKISAVRAEPAHHLTYRTLSLRLTQYLHRLTLCRLPVISHLADSVTAQCSVGSPETT